MRFCEYVFFILAIKEKNASILTTNQTPVFLLTQYLSTLIDWRVLVRAGHEHGNSIYARYMLIKC